MQSGVPLLFLFCFLPCCFAVQTFYIASDGQVGSCASPEEACGSLSDVLAVIGDADSEVVINVFPGFYNESSTMVEFPDLNHLTIQKYDPYESTEEATLLGTFSNISVSSSVTIFGLTIREYVSFLTIRSPDEDTEVEVSSATFEDIVVLLTNIDDATVTLTDITMSNIDSDTFLYPRKGFLTDQDKPERPNSFSIIRGTFDNLKYGGRILFLQCEAFNMIDTSFTRSGRMDITANDGSIENCSFISAVGFYGEVGRQGYECPLYLDGSWTVTTSSMYGNTLFTTFIAHWNTLELTVVDSTPGFYPIYATSLILHNSEVTGNLIVLQEVSISNSQLGSNGQQLVLSAKGGTITESTISQFNINGGVWSFDNVTVSYSNVQFTSYAGNCPLTSEVAQIIDTVFFQIAGGVQISCIGTVNVVNSVFEESTSSESGGGLRITDALNVELAETSFISNTARSMGGGLFLESSKAYTEMEATLQDCVFEHNIADLGAAIACSGSVSIISNGETFEDNIALYSYPDRDIYCASIIDNGSPSSKEGSTLPWLQIILGIFGGIIFITLIIAGAVANIIKYRKKHALRNSNSKHEKKAIIN